MWKLKSRWYLSMNHKRFANQLSVPEESGWDIYSSSYRHQLFHRCLSKLKLKPPTSLWVQQIQSVGSKADKSSLTSLSFPAQSCPELSALERTAARCLTASLSCCTKDKQQKQVIIKLQVWEAEYTSWERNKGPIQLPVKIQQPCWPVDI